MSVTTSEKELIEKANVMGKELFESSSDQINKFFETDNYAMKNPVILASVVNAKTSIMLKLLEK